jgi:lysophospholipase L1-like esterase
VIKANFKAYSTYVTDSLNQWDLNQVLQVTGLNLTTAPEVHFSNANIDRAIVRQATMTNHVISVAIPNSLLQDPLRINAHIGVYEGDTFKVVEEVHIPVIPRKRPADYQIETNDEEVYSFKRLENLIGNAATKDQVANIVANVGSTAELVDVRYGANGKTYASAGEAVREQFLALPLPDAAIEPTHDLDLNHYTDPANYVFALTGGLVNAPAHFIEGADVPRYLVVECFGERNDSLGGIQTWGCQTIYTVDGDKAYRRYFSYDYANSGYNFKEWRSVNHYNNHRTITTGLDLNTIVEPDAYIIATTDTKNAPFNCAGFLLEVKETSHGWLVQEAHGLHNNPCHYFRVGNNPSGVYANGATGLAVTWSEWQRSLTESDLLAIQKPNSGQIIVNMGDSLVGNTQDETSVSAQLAKITGATAHNFGFGGCRMSTHDFAPWTAFSMHALVDAIVSGDFSEQEAPATPADVPDYSPATVAAMKALDFSTVDILTIAYGVNDYTASKSLDNADDPDAIDCYGGALRYSIEKLLKTYPNIRPVVVTPAWCFWPTTDGTEPQTSDERAFNADQNTLSDFAQKCIEIAAEYHLPAVNAYDELGINVFNRAYWFNSGDGIHHNAAGRAALAKLLSGAITQM